MIAAARGFTLVELVMVVIIIALLSVVVAPRMFSLRETAAGAAEQNAVASIRTGIRTTRMARIALGEDSYPQTLDAADAGAASDDNALFGEVLDPPLTDQRWEKVDEQTYRYQQTGNEYVYDPAVGTFAVAGRRLDDTALGAPGGGGGTPWFEDALRGGPGDNWNVTAGQWNWSEDGVNNAKSGENRLFADALGDRTDYQIKLSAALDAGKGWGVWFGASLDSKDRVSGYTFQYDPGYGSGAWLLRRWENNNESVIAQVDYNFDFGSYHDFTLDVTDTGFNAYQDGELVLSYEGDLPSDGNFVGLRTWSGSQARFHSFSLSDLPTVPTP